MVNKGKIMLGELWQWQARDAYRLLQYQVWVESVLWTRDACDTAQHSTAQDGMAQPDGHTGCVVPAQVSCPVGHCFWTSVGFWSRSVPYTHLLCLFSMPVPWYGNEGAKAFLFPPTLWTVTSGTSFCFWMCLTLLSPLCFCSTSCKRSDPEWGQKSSLLSIHVKVRVKGDWNKEVHALTNDN